MNGITVHCMVRNEPFVYYAVKSVYDWVDKILLYDTGSYDAHTLEDIRTLRLEDTRGIITYKQIEIEVDETKWNKHNFRQLCRDTKGKRGKWVVRKQMIEDTTTPYFMILDGDEVHYAQTMKVIGKIPWPANKVCGFMPLIWFCDMKHTFHSSRSGRLFRTKDVGMSNSSPNEIHTVKRTGQRIGPGSDCVFSPYGVKPYAHFETMLKPWRRDVHPAKKKPFTGELPEVMQENTFYIERFQNEAHSTLHGQK